MAYVIGILVAATVLLGSAAAVLVAIARAEEILPPPAGTDKPAHTPRRAFLSFPKGRQIQ